MAVQAQKKARTPEAGRVLEQAHTLEAGLVSKQVGTPEAGLVSKQVRTPEAGLARGLLRRTSWLARWLVLAAAALPVWPLAIVTAAGYAVAWLRGWPASRLGRQAAWTLPMTAVWIAAESARGWRALTLDPVRDGASGWPHLTVLTVIRTFLLVAPVTIPAGLALAALIWAWWINPDTRAQAARYRLDAPRGPGVPGD
jgi:hypothetical protein